MQITPKDKKDWCTSARGKFIITAIAALLVCGIIAYYLSANQTTNNTKQPQAKKQTPTIFEENLHNTGVNYDIINKEIKTETPPPEPPKTTTKTPQIIPTPSQPPQRVTISEPPPILNIYTRPGKPSIDLSDRFAPYGRLIPCQLVLTIDTALAETPIVALVTENIWHAGQLIIPAGTEVHGRAIPKPTRDRVMTEKNWVLVWRTRDDDNGKELKLNGLALTKEEMLNSGSWHLHDGSAGIRGEIIKSSDMQQLLAYAAEFVATFTDNLTQESVTITDWGQTTTKSNDVKDAVNEGIAAAVRKYADKLMQQIETEGYFVRCTAGTVFYLYVTDVINMNDAEIAGTKISNKR